ncbi:MULTISPECIES: FeoA family protein [unclassified Microcoleus]|uniref:FeoA family protein n=1 Tax=unclassified Microcoleus TaxID=2642155 RepID=UPI002FD14A3F
MASNAREIKLADRPKSVEILGAGNICARKIKKGTSSLKRRILLCVLWRASRIENKYQVAADSKPKELVTKIDRQPEQMKENTQEYSQPNEQLNHRQFGAFTFYGETPEVSTTAEGTESQPDLAIGKSFPLAMASIGDKLRIVKLKGSEGTVRRLIGMGLVPGIEVQIVSNSGGSVIVGIGDNRIGLGAGMAQKIMCTN